MTRIEERWHAFAREGDPLADRTITAIGTERLPEATRLMASWTTNASIADWQPAGPADPQVVAALRAYLEEGRRLPEWMRPEQVERAEDFFMAYGPLSCTLLFCASLPECYLLPHLAEVLHAAGQLEDHTEHRIRQTAAMIFPVMMKGGLTTPEGGGVAQVLKVRLIHATIRHLVLRGPVEQASGRIEPLPAPGPRASLHQALRAMGWDVDRQGMPCSQLELAYTLLTFGYVFLAGMRTLAIPADEADEEAFLHAWNVAGHVLGIRSELMTASMAQSAAMFGAIQRAVPQAPRPDVRPGLGRALIAAMARTIHVPALRWIPVPLTRYLIGGTTSRAIGIDEHVGWPTRLLFAAGLFVTRAVDACVRIVLPTFSLTRMLTRAVGYHVLTRFLLSEARPLTLPVELLDPMKETVARWHHDAHAPGWVNRIEDRLTTEGEWRARA